MSMTKPLWFEEEIETDLRWAFGVNRIIHTGLSEFQDIGLVDTRIFGKVLILDGKVQSTEADEFVYHELLIHPAFLSHPNPKSAFVMGGGEGSTVREILKHHSVDKVVMCDIDKVVVDFCRDHLVNNKEAFASERLELVYNDAKAELQGRSEKYDVVVGDLADPLEGGPCYKLYTKSFYETVIKPHLNPGGIFVTQGGPAGILTSTQIFSVIYNTLKHVFKYVNVYHQHIPSFAETWGYVMASDHPFPLISSKEIDEKISKRITGHLEFLDGSTLEKLYTINKFTRGKLESETRILTDENPLTLHGHGAFRPNHT